MKISDPEKQNQPSPASDTGNGPSGQDLIESLESIVEFALKEMEKEPYDYAYCVFDRDGHQTYEAALELVRRSDAGKNC